MTIARLVVLSLAWLSYSAAGAGSGSVRSPSGKQRSKQKAESNGDSANLSDADQDVCNCCEWQRPQSKTLLDEMCDHSIPGTCSLANDMGSTLTTYAVSGVAVAAELSEDFGKALKSATLATLVGGTVLDMVFPTIFPQSAASRQQELVKDSIKCLDNRINAIQARIDDLEVEIRTDRLVAKYIATAQNHADDTMTLQDQLREHAKMCATAPSIIAGRPLLFDDCGPYCQADHPVYDAEAVLNHYENTCTYAKFDHYFGVTNSKFTDVRNSFVKMSGVMGQLIDESLDDLRLIGWEPLNGLLHMYTLLGMTMLEDVRIAWLWVEGAKELMSAEDHEDLVVNYGTIMGPHGQYLNMMTTMYALWHKWASAHDSGYLRAKLNQSPQVPSLDMPVECRVYKKDNGYWAVADCPDENRVGFGVVTMQGKYLDEIGEGNKQLAWERWVVAGGDCQFCRTVGDISAWNGVLGFNSCGQIPGYSVSIPCCKTPNGNTLPSKFVSNAGRVCESKLSNKKKSCGYHCCGDRGAPLSNRSCRCNNPVNPLGRLVCDETKVNAQDGWVKGLARVGLDPLGMSLNGPGGLRSLIDAAANLRPAFTNPGPEDMAAKESYEVALQELDTLQVADDERFVYLGCLMSGANGEGKTFDGDTNLWVPATSGAYKRAGVVENSVFGVNQCRLRCRSVGILTLQMFGSVDLYPFFGLSKPRSDGVECHCAANLKFWREDWQPMFDEMCQGNVPDGSDVTGPYEQGPYLMGGDSWGAEDWFSQGHQWVAWYGRLDNAESPRPQWRPEAWAENPNAAASNALPEDFFTGFVQRPQSSSDFARDQRWESLKKTPLEGQRIRIIKALLDGTDMETNDICRQGFAPSLCEGVQEDRRRLAEGEARL